jgi:hypothetical protein
MPFINRPYVKDGTLYINHATVLSDFVPGEDTISATYDTPSMRISLRLPIRHGIAGLVTATQDIARYLSSQSYWLKNVDLVAPVLKPCEQYMVANGAPLIWPLPGEAQELERVMQAVCETKIYPVYDIVREYLAGTVLGVISQTCMNSSIMRIHEWRGVHAKIVVSRDPWYMQRLFPGLSRMTINPAVRNMLLFYKRPQSILSQLLLANSTIVFKGSSRDNTLWMFGSIRMKQLSGTSFDKVYTSCVNSLWSADGLDRKHDIEIIGIRRCSLKHPPRNPKTETVLQWVLARVVSEIIKNIVNGHGSGPGRSIYISLCFKNFVMNLKTRLTVHMDLHEYIQNCIINTLRRKNPCTLQMSWKRVASLVGMDLDVEEAGVLAANCEILTKTYKFRIKTSSTKYDLIQWIRPFDISMDKSITNSPFTQKGTGASNRSVLEVCLASGASLWLMVTGMNLPVPLSEIGYNINPFITRSVARAVLRLLKTGPTSLRTKPIDIEREVVAWVFMSPHTIRTELETLNVCYYKQGMYVQRFQRAPLPPWFPSGCLSTGKRIFVHLPAYFSIPFIRMMFFVSLVTCGCTVCKSTAQEIEKKRKWECYVMGDQRMLEKIETQSEILSIFANVELNGDPHSRPTKRAISVQRPGGWVQNFIEESRRVCDYTSQWIYNPSLYPKYIYMAMELFINMQSVMCATMPHCEIREPRILDTMIESTDTENTSMIVLESHTTMSVCFIYSRKEEPTEDGTERLL